MRRRLTAMLTCLLATSTFSTDLKTGYDPGSHGHGSAYNADGSDESYGASGQQNGPAPNNGNNEWAPMVGPGPSANDKVIYHGNGHKTLVAGSPTSHIAESINYYGPPPNPPVQAPPHGYRYPAPVPQVPVGYGVETNQIHQVPTKTIVNTIKVPVPQPYKVVIDKKVPYEVKVPVHLQVPRPVQVPLPRPVQVPVDKPYEIFIERKVPYEVRVPVEVPVHVPYPVEVPQPYPVPVVVPKPVIIKHPVPVVIKYIKSGERKGLFG